MQASPTFGSGWREAPATEHPGRCGVIWPSKLLMVSSHALRGKGLFFVIILDFLCTPWAKLWVFLVEEWVPHVPLQPPSQSALPCYACWAPLRHATACIWHV